MCQVESYRSISKLSSRPHVFTSFKYFSKIQKRPGTSLPNGFTGRLLLSKIFLFLYSTNWPNFTAWLPLLREILDNMCIAIICEPGYDGINFKINHIYLIKPFFLYDQKFKTKIQISWEQKELPRWNKTYFSSFWIIIKVILTGRHIKNSHEDFVYYLLLLLFFFSFLKL